MHKKRLFLIGYQKHVLNYTIYVLLSTIIAKENKEVIQNEINTGDLDHCLDLIIPVLLEEISGNTEIQNSLIFINK